MNALPPPDYGQMMAMTPMGGYPSMGQPGIGMGQMGMGQAMPSMMTMQPMDPAVAAAAAKEAEVDERKRVEAQRKRLAATKRGPGVAALVQGALKKAQTLAQEKEEDRKRVDAGDRDDVQEVRPAPQPVETIDDHDEDKRASKEPREARAARKAKEEREAREAQERKELARKKAEEEALDRARQERETRDARVKAGLETAKKHQAARAAAGEQNLYGDMPQPDEQGEAELNEKRAREAALLQKNMDLGLPSEDRGKVVFLDIDGVLP